MTIDIDIDDPQWDTIADLGKKTEQAVLLCLPAAQQNVAISVLFTNDAEIQILNRDWRGQNKATNVLSFPAPEDVIFPPDEPPPLGDLALAFETIAKESQEQNKTIVNHLTHLIMHGTLHLLGYDHETNEDAAEMEALEVSLLAKLGIADPYLT